MGGLFRAPKPVVVRTEPVPASPPAPSPEAVAQTARLESQDRARRGLAGTIATSARGVLEPLPPGLAGSRKTLLGE
ncbi:hypothetical protein [Teichococcus cervicalis]|uniref:Uncharacterized protein n=1 Tax=Pseudoroseomonas cervicalis ATCC 49957 TaxID=525371 RepID=D5RHJ2_9PROT|nr:hypothetical protein [Pseudoroseomonas cervicalis]EFH13244.1 hypothetical protein HMPREF0731_0551 [Pseudoroseomonas cervicalis ATCC 49957]